MRFLCPKSPIRTILFAAVIYLLAATSAQTQTPPPYLYVSIPVNGTTSQVVGFSVALDGTLKQVPGPLNLSTEGGLVTTDPSDQFLFVLNATSNTISVLSIDQSTGALSQVGVPVPAPSAIAGSGGLAPSVPVGMATFKGTSPNPNFLFVAYQNTTPPTAPPTGAIVAFQIGTTSPFLIPTVQTNLLVGPFPANIVTRPIVNSTLDVLYAVLESPGSFSGVGVFQIDPAFGALNPESSPGGVHLNEQSLAINPTGTLIFDGWGGASGGFESSVVSPADGSLPSSPASTIPSPSPPSLMLVDGSGKLLYVEENGAPVAYLIDPSSGELTSPSSPPTALPPNLIIGDTVADPVLPFLYSVQGGEIHVFEIADFTSGALRELNSSPTKIVGAGGANGLTLTHNAAARTAPQFDAQLLPLLVTFVETTVGDSNSDSSLLLTNIGTQPLDADVSITGDDPADFTKTSCPSPLPPNKSCTITVTFTPTQSGTHDATLTVTWVDSNGPETRTTQLTGNAVAATSGSPGGGGTGTGGSGTGGGSGGGGTGGGGTGTDGSGMGSGGSGGSPSPTPQSAISFSSTALSFNATAINGTPPPQNIAITSAAATSLTITNFHLTGANASDFKLTSDCNTSSSSTYPQYQGCTITVAFTPSALGSRFAQILVTDSAPNSPQTIALSGVTQPESLTISPDASETGQSFQETITAGQTALFKLQLVSTFNGTVSFSPCAGVPSSASCSAPAQLSVTANQVTPFTISLATTAATSISHFHYPNTPPPANLALAVLFLAAIATTFTFRRALPFSPLQHSRAISLCPSVILLSLLVLTPFALIGCGGASTVATAPAAVAPTAASQTYTITITATATTSADLPVPPPPPIQLTLIVN